jgi:hypothetical protein
MKLLLSDLSWMSTYEIDFKSIYGGFMVRFIRKSCILLSLGASRQKVAALIPF